jgi:thiol-disulfide isomerase/thioredoxin
MRNYVFIFALTILHSAALAQNLVSSDKPPRILSVSELEARIAGRADTCLAINIWATWCIPCVRELPLFEQAAADFSGTPLKFLLVSLDMPKHLQTRLVPFIKERGIEQEVVLLDTPPGQAWMSAINPVWSGAIPATIVYCAGSISFHEAEFDSQDDLNLFIQKSLEPSN